MLIKKVQKNQPITADMINNIIDSIRECQLQAGVGYSFNRSSGGTTLTIKPSVGSGGGASVVTAQCPFDVQTTISNGELLVKVGVGTLNGLYATNYAICLSFESTDLSTAVCGSTNVIIDVQTDGKQITNYALDLMEQVNTMTPTNPLAPTNFQWPIAHIRDGTVYRIIGCGSLQAIPVENVRVAKVPATPSDNAYDIFYYWSLESV